VSELAELRRLQRWLGAAIAGGEPAEDPPGGAGAVLSSTAELSAERRLALYARSHRLRLLGAMRASYPGLCQLLGAELFDEFALDYLRAHPSRSPSLQRLGDAFPDHLAATRPDAGGVPEAWPQTIVDLARLERTVAEVYDAPGLEGEDALSGAALPATASPAWLAAQAEPSPCLRLLRASFPAGAFLSAVRRGEEPPLPLPAPSFVAVCRREFAVTLTPLEPASHRLLERLLAGARLGDAAAAAGLGPAEAWRLLGAWADAAFFRALRLGRRPGPPSPPVPDPVQERV
jgi:hypothetical protein